jgi:hypothetical protein
LDSLPQIKSTPLRTHFQNQKLAHERTIAGTYIAPRPKHLDRYLDEQIYRFNVREQSDNERFVGALKGADSKRLTYKSLIGKN